MTRKTKSSRAAEQSSNLAGNSAGASFQEYPIRTRNDTSYQSYGLQNNVTSAYDIEPQMRNLMINDPPEPQTAWPYQTPSVGQNLMRSPPINGPIQKYQNQFQVNIAPRPLGPPPPDTERTPRGNHALQDYQMQLMLLEQQNKNKERLTMRGLGANVAGQHGAPLPSQRAEIEAQNATGIQDYQSELKSLDQQNKSRLMQERQAAENAAQISNTGAMDPRQLAAKTQEEPDAQTQLAMIEREEQALIQESSRPPGEKRHDYQIQLLLLELQNKKRKIRSTDGAEAPARNDAEPVVMMPNAPSMPSSQYSSYQYHVQLMQLEQQNKKRLLDARRELESTDARVARDEVAAHKAWRENLWRQRGLSIQQEQMRMQQEQMRMQQQQMMRQMQLQDGTRERQEAQERSLF